MYPRPANARARKIGICFFGDVITENLSKTVYNTGTNQKQGGTLYEIKR